jgi:hypothetical protein
MTADPCPTRRADRERLGVTGKTLARETFQGHGVRETNENVELPKKKIGCARNLVDGMSRTELRIRSRCPQSSTFAEFDVRPDGCINLPQTETSHR